MWFAKLVFYGAIGIVAGILVMTAEVDGQPLMDDALWRGAALVVFGLLLAAIGVRNLSRHRNSR